MTKNNGAVHQIPPVNDVDGMLPSYSFSNTAENPTSITISSMHFIVISSRCLSTTHRKQTVLLYIVGTYNLRIVIPPTLWHQVERKHSPFSTSTTWKLEIKSCEARQLVMLPRFGVSCVGSCKGLLLDTRAAYVVDNGAPPALPAAHGFDTNKTPLHFHVILRGAHGEEDVFIHKLLWVKQVLFWFQFQHSIQCPQTHFSYLPNIFLYTSSFELSEYWFGSNSNTPLLPTKHRPFSEPLVLHPAPQPAVPR